MNANIAVDNTPPTVRMFENPSTDGKSQVRLSFNEEVLPLSGWNSVPFGLSVTKEFSNPVSYPLLVFDFAQNSSEVFLNVKLPTAITLTYGSYDSHSLYQFVSAGKVSAPNTVSSHSICKTEAIFIKLSEVIRSIGLEGRVYVHSYWGPGSKMICHYSNLYYYYGYNPNSNGWLNLSSQNIIYWGEDLFSQLGGVGLNTANSTCATHSNPIPNSIAKQYLYGISGIQFRLRDSSEFSVVYQSYIQGLGWLPASSDGEENYSQHDKPISTFRMNLIPRSEKQYLIDFWNRDIGTSHID